MLGSIDTTSAANARDDSKELAVEVDAIHICENCRHTLNGDSGWWSNGPGFGGFLRW